MNRTSPVPGASPTPRTRPQNPGFTSVAVLLALLILVRAGDCLATGPVSVLDLAPGSEGGADVAVISMSDSPEAVRSFSLPDPPRLVLDLSSARLDGPKRNLEITHPMVSSVRMAQFNARTVRVVLDLRGSPAHEMAVRPLPGSGLYRLAVGIVPGNGDAREAGGQAPVHKAAASAETAAPPEQGHGTVLVFGDDKTSAQLPESSSRWGKLDVSGFLMVKGAQELHESGYPEQARTTRGTGRIEGKWTPPNGSGTNAVPGGETTYVLASAQYDYLGFGPDPSYDDHDLDLFEGYLLHATPGWEARLGRQIVRWGKTDQISPVDNLNPQDLREFFIPELEDRKIPNWMARVRLFPGEVTLEAVFIPFFLENEFEYTGNTWALVTPEPTDLRIVESDPGEGLDASDWGVRASTSLGKWDLAASFLQATEKTPALQLDALNPAGPTLEAKYRRQNIVGFEFETVLDSFGFRGEAAWFDRQSLNTEDFDPASSPMLHWVVGLDYIGEADWYANVQLSHQHIFEYDSDTLFLRRDNFYLNGEINREFWRGNAMLKLRYAVDLHDGGSFFTPEAILTYFRNLELSLGANAFFGPRDSLFGRYRDNDQAFLRATWRF